MSWLYSRALVAAYWEDDCSDGEPSARLNMNPMPPLFLPNDKMTDFSRLSRFGMTFGPLTDDLGEDVLTWFLEGFHAKTSAQQEREPGSPESAADSGWRWPESSVKYDPAMRLWKTRQCSLFEDSEWFSETWPRWGLMRAGECWELPMSERPTFARGSGLLPTIRSTDGERGGRGDLIQAVRGNANSHYRLWQTPVADDVIERTKGKMNSRGKPKLSAQVKMWPTPQARDHFPAHKPEYIAAKKAQGHGMSNLNDAVAMQRFTTPRTPSKTGGGTGLDGGAGAQAMMDEKTRKELTGGSLNPTWVEWLMGWPLGWSDCAPLATDKYRNALP